MEKGNATTTGKHVHNQVSIQHHALNGHPLNIPPCKNNLQEVNTIDSTINRKTNLIHYDSIQKPVTISKVDNSYYNCSIKEFKHLVEGHLYACTSRIFDASNPDTNPNSILIKKVNPLSSLLLIRYLHQRGISPTVADPYVREIHYLHGIRKMAVIGHKNNSAGWALMGESIQKCFGPKDITTVDNGGHKVAVFDNLLNFLSFLEIFKKARLQPINFIILNNMSLFEKPLPYMQSHTTIHLYLNRECTGQDVTQKALRLGAQYRDESCLYQHYKDLNHWLTSMGKTIKVITSR